MHMQSESEIAIGLKFVVLCSPIAHLRYNISIMTTNNVVKDAYFFIISIVLPVRHLYFHPQYCISYIYIYIYIYSMLSALERIFFITMLLETICVINFHMRNRKVSILHWTTIR